MIEDLAIALGLGLLVGMQRERAQSVVAGIRTFPLITVLGVVCGILAERFGGWIIVAGFLCVTAMIVMANLGKFRGGRIDPGVTTEIAAILMFAVGVVIVTGYTAAALAIGGGVAVLLQWKRPLHQWVRRFRDTDFKAIFQMVLIALVILPVLPNKAYGPYRVLNPFEIWLIVVLIVGISLGAYAAYKVLGARVGTLLAGVLGGFISSTATTVGYARKTREAPASSAIAAVVVMIASTIMIGRVLFEIAVVAPSILFTTAPPLIVMMAFMTLICAVMFFISRGTMAAVSEHEPHSSLAVAIGFGLLFSVVLIAVAFAKENFGQSGVYAVAALSGLTDMDAITLSTARMISAGGIDTDTGWRVILVGAMANLVFKGLAVATLGHRRLLKHVTIAFGVTLIGAVSILMYWPSASVG